MAGIDNNTVFYLRGDSFTDLSPSNVTITNNGVTIVDNRLNFDGVNDLLSIPNDVIDLDNDFTIEFYVRINNSINYKTILGNGAPNDSTIQGIVLYVDGSNALGCEFGFTSGKYQFSINTSEHSNSLTHIAFVKNGSTYAFFVNGVMKSSYSNTSSIIKNSQPFTFGKNRNNATYLNMILCDVRISNIARYAEDFTPPTKPYNSININITNKDNNKIDFNISKLGQEVINKVEVLINGVVSKTYDNIGELIYNIDNNLCYIGNNKIKIKVTYDDNYVEEKELDYEYRIDKIPTSSSLKDLIDRQELLADVIEVQKNALKSILESKNVDVTDDEDKMSSLIDKVNLFDDYVPPLLYLYNAGNERESVTGGFNYIASYLNSASIEYIKDKKDTYFEIKSKGTASGFITNNKINLNSYSKLYVDVEVVSTTDTANGYAEVVVSSNSSGTSVVSLTRSASTGRKTYSLNIDTIRGEYYIYCNCNSGNSSTVHIKFHKIWLEK